MELNEISKLMLLIFPLCSKIQILITYSANRNHKSPFIKIESWFAGPCQKSGLSIGSSKFGPNWTKNRTVRTNPYQAIHESTKIAKCQKVETVQEKGYLVTD